MERNERDALFLSLGFLAPFVGTISVFLLYTKVWDGLLGLLVIAGYVTIAGLALRWITPRKDSRN